MVDGIHAKIEPMPGILKAGCAAAFLVGVLQLVAIIFPVFSPDIGGLRLSKPALQLIMGLGHIVLGWGIFKRKLWARPLLVALPVFQYAVLYIEIRQPLSQIPAQHMILTGAWAAFFSFHCYRGRGRKYFEPNAESS